LEPWHETSAEQSAALNFQLQRELSSGHVLYGLKVKAVAKSKMRDDVLFEVIGHEKPLILVHLTWSKTSSDDPRWPQAQFFGSWDDWVRETLLPDHEEFREQLFEPSPGDENLN
jgi:hypothetical protein